MKYPDKVGRGGYYIEEEFGEYIIYTLSFGDYICNHKTLKEAEECVQELLQKYH